MFEPALHAYLDFAEGGTGATRPGEARGRRSSAGRNPKAFTPSPAATSQAAGGDQGSMIATGGDESL